MGPLETLMKSVILGVFAVVGLRYVLVNALRIAHMRRIERTGTQTIAHVTRGWETRLSRRQLVYWLEVRFDLPDGRVVEADRQVTELFRRRNPDGSQVAVRYLHADPTEFVFVDDMRLIESHRVHMVVGMVMTAMAGLGFLFIRR